MAVLPILWICIMANAWHGVNGAWVEKNQLWYEFAYWYFVCFLFRGLEVFRSSAQDVSRKSVNCVKIYLYSKFKTVSSQKSHVISSVVAKSCLYYLCKASSVWCTKHRLSFSTSWKIYNCCVKQCSVKIRTFLSCHDKSKI